MSLTEYFRLLRRWGWILILMALITAASAYVFSAAQTPVYRSSVLIIVQPARPDFGLTQSAKDLLRSYVSVINTETYAQKVIDVLKLDRTREDLKGDVTIAEDSSRLAIQIDVLNTNGDQGNDIARVWAELFLAWRDEQNAQVRREDKVGAVIVDAPRYSLYRPNKTVNTAAGAILGVLLGGVIIFAVEYLEAGVIRSTEEAERVLGLPVLGAIPPLEGSAAQRRQRLLGPN